MFGSLPAIIDPLRLADEGVRLKGELSPEAMPRLLALCRGPGGQVVLDLSFERSSEGQRLMRGRLDAELSFTCQRCLEAVSCPVHADVMLLLRRPGETARSADESDEALEVPGPLSLAALVEDELILALPMFARHAPGTCRTAAAAEDDTGGERPHPFAGLKRLKRGKDER
jgi:uncharacterized protein